MDSRILVQWPPDGAFSADALAWTLDMKHGLVEVAQISLKRLTNFLDDEGRRVEGHETSFNIRRSSSKPGPK
jgi:hypothetical protein